jgi:hypothetical protein
MLRGSVTLMHRVRGGSPLVFLFVTVLVDMVGYGLVVPLLPFYTRQHAGGAAPEPVKG